MMPADRAVLEALLARIEGGADDSLELLRLLLPRELTHPWVMKHGMPLWSLDAAAALFERVLPGWIWDVTSSGTAWVASDYADPDEPHAGKAATPARALCIAILKAKLHDA